MTVVFGGSSGIGRAIAERCARDGDAIVIVGRTVDKLRRAADGIEAIGARSVHWLATDVSDADRLRGTLAELVAIAPTPRRVVLNGGGPRFARFTELSMSDWRSAIDAVLLSQVHILQELVPRLQRGASVVAVLSDAVRNAGPEKVLPCSLRLALLGMLKCVALQFAGAGVRFNAISPGPTDTDRARALIAAAAQSKGTTPEEERERLSRSLPMGRLASPDEVAAVAHFLLSDAAGYVSGINYVCDGCVTTVPL